MKKIISIVLTVAMLLSVVLPAFATDPVRSSNVEASFTSGNITSDPQDSAVITLAVEGLGTDPDNNQIDSVSFSSSDDSVADIGSYTVSTYTPDGESEATGLTYETEVFAGNTGIATVTANVVDTNGNTYTCSCFVTVRGIILNKKNITLEVGEACVVFAERYGFSETLATRGLSWTKNAEDLSWISIGTHGTGRQNEAYYIKGVSKGTGSLTASLSGSSYSDTVNITVIPAMSVTVEENGAEVTSAVDLSSANSVTLDAVCDGFINPTITWESCNPDLVSVTQSGDSAVISRINYSDFSAAVKVTASENDVTRTKTVYVNVADPDAVSLKISSSRLENGVITIKQGDTLTLSAVAAGLDPTATVWSATADGGRAPVKLNSTVGKNITITGRAATSSPIAVTAENGSESDTVYVNVTQSADKSVRITGDGLCADGFIAMSTDGTASLSVELNGFSGNPTVNWTASVAPNSENSNGSGTCPVALSDATGDTTLVTAVSSSLDFAKICVSVTDGGNTYTDEILVKVSDVNIINARYVGVFNKDAVTLSTVNGEPADWASNSQKTYFGPTSRKPTYDYDTASATVSTNGTTMNPSRLTAEQDGYTDSVYVKVNTGNWKTVTFNLNGAYGKTPDSVVMSTLDSYQSFVLPVPEATYQSDGSEYVFYGWSDKADAAKPNSTGVMYFADEEYSVPSDKSSVVLYAIWVKKTDDAMFTLRLTGDIAPEPSGQSVADYARSSVYIEDAIDPSGFYFNINGVESHLVKTPSDEQIIRALSCNFDNGEPMTFNPDTDRIIWYVVKRTSDDNAGVANWHVDGVLIRGGRYSITYDKNIPVANVSNIPNPSRTFYFEDENVNIISQVPSCSSDRFIGWNSQPDGRGQWYTSTGSLYNGHTTAGTVETSITVTEDTVLYAVWEGRLYYDINEDGFEDIDDIAYIISASVGDVTLTERQAEKADFNADGVVDAFDAAELERILFLADADKGDVDQDGDLDLDDYAMIKAHISGVDSDANHPANLLDKSYLPAVYDSVKDSYGDGVIITQQYYCADYDSDKAVDAFDLFCLDKYLNGLA
ncbi:MAG: dockerin type I domain-containing protein [Clostridiaceae bacterium]|nr:dockerin type I domain-containing protein [Clostridiaceae bacterium]